MKKLAIVGFILLLLLGFSGQSMAGIHIDVNIPLPPFFVFLAPPELVVIPGTYVYYCPDVDFNIFFYGGYWYRSYGGHWYRSASYGGPWGFIASPPYVLLSLPPNFRIITRGERYIPYGELQSNWRAWERGGYWEHHNWGRMEHERYQELAPSFREREHDGYGSGVRGRGEFRGGSGFHKGGGYEDYERR
jgi:hypothetical protein